MKVPIAFLALVVGVTAQASPVEVWECQQVSYGNWSDILVIASVEEGREIGTVEVAGVVHQAQFRINGFDRRWDFGSKEDPYLYAFVVRPGGDAAYYDFRGEKNAKPSNFMHCRQRAPSK
jgi:hypothetical protein